MIQLDHHEHLLPLARCCSSWWSKPEMQGLQWLQVTVWPHFQVARSVAPGDTLAIPAIQRGPRNVAWSC
jgi:hypothetical protein